MSLTTVNGSGAGPGPSPPATDPPQKDLIKGIQGIPLEMLQEIMSYLELSHLGRLRLANCYLERQIWSCHYRDLVKNRPIYATNDDMSDFIGMLRVFAWRGLDLVMTEIDLVADGVKAHEYGVDWAWEDLLLSSEDMIECTDNDRDILASLNRQHTDYCQINQHFANSGGYRSRLVMILQSSPNVNTVNVRHLQPDEHIKGWANTEKLKELSFYKPGLNTKDIYYGDWKYDTVKLRVTQYKDEFGEDIIEPGSGPQASFLEDLTAAIVACGRQITVNFVSG
ncbi:hypothetical protein ACEQ8H_008254 [Pleosporales sp. CAS-2024a]